MHIHMPIKMYWPRLFDNFNHDYVGGSQSFICLPSFMFVGAAVSEIRESNCSKKKNLQNGHINDPIFHQSYLLTLSTQNVLEVWYTTN